MPSMALNLSSKLNQLSFKYSQFVLFLVLSYNIDYRSEKINSHMNRLQEKYVKAETYSSCLSSNVTFPKCVKRKPTTYQADLRRSPRKKSAKRSYDESVEFSENTRKR